MKTNGFTILIIASVFFLCGALPVYSDQTTKADPAGSKGLLELECNLADVDLHLCPYDQFERKEVRRFFGLFTSYQESCSGEQMALGTTPIKPVELPKGRYVLLIPPDYAWEHKGQIEVNVAAREKTFFLLKLFMRPGTGGSDGPGDSGGGSGGSGGGGSGSGGGVGTARVDGHRPEAQLLGCRHLIPHQGQQR